MIWFYQRGSDALTVETRFDNETTEYIAVLHHPDGTEEVERFTDRTEYSAYLRKLERRLAEARWQRARGPELLPEGWRDRKPD